MTEGTPSPLDVAVEGTGHGKSQSESGDCSPLGGKGKGEGTPIQKAKQMTEGTPSPLEVAIDGTGNGQSQSGSGECTPLGGDGIGEGGCLDETVPSRMIGKYTEKFLIEKAKEMIERRTKTWLVTTLHAEDRLPRLARDEIVLGRELGRGGFFTVSEIQKITLLGDDVESEDVTAVMMANGDGEVPGVIQNRKFMEKNCIRLNMKERYPRYCFKTMQQYCKEDAKLFVNTLVDLAIEAQLLANIRHPHIIKLRAMSEGFLSSAEDFIILDRLYETLDTKIEDWKVSGTTSCAKLCDFRGKHEKALLAERLTVANDIGSALSYLHDRNIIYRDLKPTNIGFDVRKDAKLFDFGLVTEFDVKNQGKYQMTGETGTVRYMAPEVALNQPYTEKADVYSFGILLWQILSLEEPYGKMSAVRIEASVTNLGLRPTINPSWSKALRRLLQDCFAAQPRRPTMEVVCSVLQREVNSVSDKKQVGDGLVGPSGSSISARQHSSRYFED